MQSFEEYEIVSCPKNTDSIATSSEIVLNNVAILIGGCPRERITAMRRPIVVSTPPFFGVGIQDCPNGEGNKSSYENAHRDIVTLVVSARALKPLDPPDCQGPPIAAKATPVELRCLGVQANANAKATMRADDKSFTWGQSATAVPPTNN